MVYWFSLRNHWIQLKLKIKYPSPNFCQPSSLCQRSYHYTIETRHIDWQSHTSGHSDTWVIPIVVSLVLTRWRLDWSRAQLIKTSSPEIERISDHIVYVFLKNYFAVFIIKLVWFIIVHLLDVSTSALVLPRICKESTCKKYKYCFSQND